MSKAQTMAVHGVDIGVNERWLAHVVSVLIEGQNCAAKSVRSTMAILPVLMLYVIFSGQFIRDITLGAVK